jgi:hypothetical protein
MPVKAFWCLRSGLPAAEISCPELQNRIPAVGAGTSFHQAWEARLSVLFTRNRRRNRASGRSKPKYDKVATKNAAQTLMGKWSSGTFVSPYSSGCEKNGCCQNVKAIGDDTNEAHWPQIQKLIANPRWDESVGDNQVGKPSSLRSSCKWNCHNADPEIYLDE